MIDNFEMQRRYFTVQLEKFGKKPELHRAMIRDCEHYLKMLEETGSAGAFARKIQQTGNMVSTAKANVRDRYENRMVIYEKLNRDKKVLEDRLRLEIVESAQTHGELTVKIEEFERETKLAFNENKALNSFNLMMHALFQLCVEPPGSNGEGRELANFRQYWGELKEADPEVSWEKIMTHNAYRDRIPFTDAQMAFLGAGFREVSCG